ncbi:MAG: flagellar basal body rod protein FlgB [Lachnospiraceae bacterium]|jgi:flagellar basal-body rod protein FlgB|nr:flagellar basal body rod protein FlgB [Lachnospiraceae bacterium]
MIRTDVFDYINVMDKAADASWLRNKAIANNIANEDTPGYKRKDVDFEGALKTALLNNRYVSMDDKVRTLTSSELSVGIKTEEFGYSYRLDRNNVDIEQEQAELASNQIKYQAIINSLTGEFANLKAVIK